LVLLTVLLATLLAGITLFGAHASTCAEWDHCPITQRYGQNAEHGVDLLTQGLPVTALRSGTITFSHEQCWSGECVMDITWKLDFPSHAGGSRICTCKSARVASTWASMWPMAIS